MKILQIRIFQLSIFLLLLGLVTGFLIPLAVSKTIPWSESMILGAHLNGILGSFILFLYGVSVPYLKYKELGLRRIALLLILSNYANWAVTLLKSSLLVHGIQFQGEILNDSIFILLSVLVVLPSILGTVFWLLGFSLKEV